MKLFIFGIIFSIYFFTVNGSDLGTVEPCRSLENCTDQCTMGRKNDTNGCPVCYQCIVEGVVEGDILVDSRSYGEYVKVYDESECENKENRGVINDDDYKWPNRNGEVVVLYTFKRSTFDSERLRKIQDVMRYFESKTCIKFYRRNREASYIEFVGTGGCSSYVGRIGNAQQVNLGPGCTNRRGTIIHEIMHALGFWHEHSRPDRDQYININFANIRPGAEANFKKQHRTIYRNSPYDINSVMHYSGYSFSKNRQATIRRRDNGRPVVAQREDFSVEDLKEINSRYCPKYTDKPVSVTAAPTKRPTATPLTVRPTSKCEETNKNCKFWKTRSFCTGKYSSFMRSNCPLTCGFCKAPETNQRCEDKNKDMCPKLVKAGICRNKEKGWQSYIQKNCRKSCNLCQSKITSPSYPTTTPTTTTTTTTTATTTRRPTQCKDESSSCQFWKSQGHCQRRSTHYRFMQQACPRACGFCTSTTKPPQRPTSTVRPATSSYVPCGTVTVEKESHRALLQRIVGGRSAIHGTIPWIVSIRRSANNEFCGGTIINNNYIVTAAHCFYKGNTFNPDVSRLMGFVGKHHRSAYQVDKGQQVIRFSKVIKHPNYDHSTSNNDIAILKLTTPLRFSDYVRPICLPGQGRELANHTEAFVSGWGSRNGGGSFPDELQQAEVFTIKNHVCNRWLRSRLDRGYDEVTENMFCAGHQRGGKDACQGDSGGPLTIEERGRNYLVGVVSWGYGCAQRSRPGVYTKVSRMVHWIYRNMQ